jgi:hypothetical protein
LEEENTYCGKKEENGKELKEKKEKKKSQQ